MSQCGWIHAVGGRCELIAGHDDSHQWERPIPGGAPQWDTPRRPAPPMVLVGAPPPPPPPPSPLVPLPPKLPRTWAKGYVKGKHVQSGPIRAVLEHAGWRVTCSVCRVHGHPAASNSPVSRNKHGSTWVADPVDAQVWYEHHLQRITHFAQRGTNSPKWARSLSWHHEVTDPFTVTTEERWHVWCACGAEERLTLNVPLAEWATGHLNTVQHGEYRTQVLADRVARALVND